jgi:hypothetical protein
MKVSGQFHTLATLPWGKSVPIASEAGWTPEPVRALLKKISHPRREPIMIPRSSSPQPAQYTDYIILAPGSFDKKKLSLMENYICLCLF